MARRAILVMHGVGSQEKGQTLNDVVEPLARFLQRPSASPGHPEGLRLDVDMRPEQGPAHATPRFQVGSEDEEWVITEAWWAKRFFANSTGPVLRWGFAALVRHGWSIVYGILVRPAVRPDEPEPNDEVYREPKARALSRLWDILVALAVAVLYIPAAIVIIGLAAIFYVIAMLPTWLLIPIPAAAAVRALVNSLVDGPGDQQVMTSNYLARDSASRAVVEALAPHLDHTAPDYTPCDTVTIIAHSGGAVVSYDALSGPDVKGWSFGNGRTSVTWFTVGSGLNLAYRMGATRGFWNRGLDPRITWVNLWARYDPVPHGPAIPELLQQIATGSDAADRCRSLRVVNRDNPFADHGEYWRNYEEVVSRFVYEIMGRPQGGQPLRDAVAKAVGEIERHRHGVATIVSLRFLVAAVAAAAAWLTDADAALGAWAFDAVDELPFLDASTVALVEGWRIFLGVGLDVLVGVALLGLAAYLAYRFLTALLRGRLERGEDWGEAPARAARTTDDAHTLLLAGR